jgi:hypothetical protein
VCPRKIRRGRPQTDESDAFSFLASLIAVVHKQGGKLTTGEAHKLQTITRDIRRNLGYTDQEISKKLKNISLASTI